MRQFHLVLLCVLSLSICFPNRAYAAPKTILIGNTEIILPHIVGLDDELMNIPEFKEYMNHFAPDMNTLHWAYISLDDKQRILQEVDDGLQTYILVETEKNSVHYQWTTPQFHTLQENFHKQYKTLFTDNTHITDELLREQTERFNSSYGMKFDVQRPVFQDIGIMEEGKHYITIAYRMITNGNVEGNSKRIDQAVLINVILAANKLLYVYVYDSYRDGEGLRQAMSISQEFVQKTLKTNPNRG